MQVQFPHYNAEADGASATFHSVKMYLDAGNEDKALMALEIPDYLKCPIKEDLMDEPVMI